MKLSKIICFVLSLLLISLVVYKVIHKDHLYIYFEDLKGYSTEYSSPNDTLKSTKILIRQEGKLSYQWWELEVDRTKSESISTVDLQNIVINSQYFIINNYGGIGNKGYLLTKYKFNIIVRKNNDYFVVPVKSIRYGME